jgi:hypothetical protein
MVAVFARIAALRAKESQARSLFGQKILLNQRHP